MIVPNVFHYNILLIRNNGNLLPFQLSASLYLRIFFISDILMCIDGCLHHSMINQESLVTFASGPSAHTFYYIMMYDSPR